MTMTRAEYYGQQEVKGIVTFIFRSELRTPTTGRIRPAPTLNSGYIAA